MHHSRTWTQLGEAVAVAVAVGLGRLEVGSAEGVGAGLCESVRPGAVAPLVEWVDGPADAECSAVWLAEAEAEAEAEAAGELGAGCLVGDALGDGPAVSGSASSVGAA